MPPDVAYPLALLSPASDKTDQLDLRRVQPAEPRLCTCIPPTPRRAASRDGDVVRVFNDLGEVHVPVARARRAAAGASSSLPKGLWRSSTLNGSTATALVPDDLTDIGAGACFNDARVEVERTKV